MLEEGLIVVYPKYVDQIVVKHLKRVVNKHCLDKETYSVLIIDCWPTHTASGAGSFLSWLKKKHPKIIPLFIPAGCECFNLAMFPSDSFSIER